MGVKEAAAMGGKEAETMPLLLPAKKQRDPHFDNAKWLAMALVISGHVFNSDFSSGGFTENVFCAPTWIHIPLFAMLSGAVSKKPPT